MSFWESLAIDLFSYLCMRMCCSQPYLSAVTFPRYFYPRLPVRDIFSHSTPTHWLIKQVRSPEPWAPYFLVSFGPCVNEQLMSNNRAQTAILFWVLIPNTKAFLPSVSVADPHRLTRVFPATTGTTIRWATEDQQASKGNEGYGRDKYG